MTPYVPHPPGPQYIESTKVTQFNVSTSGFVLQTGNFSREEEEAGQVNNLNIS